MKKRTELFLISAVLMMSLTACGNPSPETETTQNSGGMASISEKETETEKTKYNCDALLAYIEADDYDRADQELKNLMNDVIQQKLEEEKKASEEKITDFWKDKIYGVWAIDPEQTETVTVRKDGTCDILGKTYEFRTSSSNESRLTAWAYEENVPQYFIDYRYLEKNDFGYEETSLNVHKAKINEYGDRDFEYDSIYLHNEKYSGRLLRTDGYKTVELTTENFWDYFEYRWCMDIQKNAFDEISTVNAVKYIAIKEEYTNLWLMNTNIDLELSYKIGDIDYSVDLQNRKVNLDENSFRTNEFLYGGGEESSITRFKINWVESETERIYYFGNSVEIFRMTGDPSGQTLTEYGYTKDDQLVRVVNLLMIPDNVN